ncbi:hypothetical protein AAFC00_003538 [Neodothiora populina]|uniref:DUF4484 domain-containing protein n=1 Tax=Neodothiora populina TaxID=2781224 RepID=A0ABR3PEH8_9PEZI
MTDLSRSGLGEAASYQGLPPISALYVAVFEKTIGYSIAYQRSTPGLQLDGVEYKSLCSGLHHVQSDLVYFVHDEYAGVSAFVQGEAAEEHRNANFAAVGVLVPLSYGRLGRSWLHAKSLRELAQLAVHDLGDTSQLDAYWESNRVNDERGHEEDESVSKQSENVGRKSRAFSDAAALGKDSRDLSEDHPALSLASHLETFGPLLFPLYRAALLRKRILILTQTPVRQACELVYNLSVLSKIPSQSVEAFPLDEAALTPARPLFNIGVHDIDFLTKTYKRREGSEDEVQLQESYIACSTDEILATKQNLYDILVELPPPEKDGGRKEWPKMRSAAGESIKATQRDLRRFQALEKELRRITRATAGSESGEGDSDGESDHDGDSTPLIQSVRPVWARDDDTASLADEKNLVEPTTWTAMIQESFLWWASAGERDTWVEEETSQDLALLGDLPMTYNMERDSARPQSISEPGTEVGSSSADRRTGSKRDNQAKALTLIAFIHRLTALTLECMADMAESAGSEGDGSTDEEGDRAIGLESDDIRHMGLDVWSKADTDFVRELFALYFRRETEVRGQGVECCGIKIC